MLTSTNSRVFYLYTISTKKKCKKKLDKPESTSLDVLPAQPDVVTFHQQASESERFSQRPIYLAVFNHFLARFEHPGQSSVHFELVVVRKDLRKIKTIKNIKINNYVIKAKLQEA